MDAWRGTQPAANPTGDFALGPVLVSPALRRVTGPGGHAVLEPRMMQVLVQLARQPGRLVTRRELILESWQGAPVGDDSINRAIAGVRRAARDAANGAFTIDTVPGSGYVLRVAGVPERAPEPDGGGPVEALAEGWRAWRLGLPAVNPATLESLRLAARDAPGRADTWGLLSLLLRHALEHASADDCPSLVYECEEAAAKALAIDPDQPEARAALIGLWPIFGDWTKRKAALSEGLDLTPGHPPLQHDLVILEMSTGKVSTAIGYLEQLHERDPQAAIYHYKLIYQYWTLGRASEADRVADGAMQLWPRHPAIWFARFFHLAFTGRAVQAAQQLEDEANRPPIPPVALIHLRATVASLVDPTPDRRAEAIDANLAAAARGPAQCVQAIVNLSGLGEVDAAFDVARGYYLQSGPLPVGIRKTASDPTVNELHRRATQPLFIPTAASMRADPRFLPLCEEMGLARYWQETGVTPDFLT